jgi:hypothetical protein
MPTSPEAIWIAARVTVERGAVAANPPAQHDQSGFRHPQFHVIDGIQHRAQALLDFLGAGLRQNRHGAAARRRRRRGRV